MAFSLYALAFQLSTCFAAVAIAAAPQDLTASSGDRSVSLYWRPVQQHEVKYLVSRADAPDGPFQLINGGSLARSPAWCDLQVTNNRAYYYRVAAVDSAGKQGEWSSICRQTPGPFASETAFLDHVQETAFRYFWHTASPENGLIPDRSSPASPCSVAAVGFGLTALGIGVDHRWITRSNGCDRAMTTLQTLLDGPQGSVYAGTMGFRGWFYHFLDMEQGLRYTRFNTELSSIDTALLLAGVIYAREYFDADAPQERKIRELADAILDRVDWQWMADESRLFRMGWHPETGFLKSRWSGYNEASLLYLLAIGAKNNPVPPAAWRSWTDTFSWKTNHGFAYLEFPPLFGHQYSQCWYDLRSLRDDYMRRHESTYFESSRRATLAQRAYCMLNPGKHKGYGPQVWGLTACDGPTGYLARGAPPAFNDDGTIAPTAVGGSVPFAPEVCLPALRYFYDDEFRASLWSAYGFRDAFNLGANWWATDVLGIDQGPILIMIENHRTGRVWRTFMRNRQVQEGLRLARFK